MGAPDTSLQPIVEFLTGRIGLDPGSIGKETVERALNKRMHAVHAADAEAYLSKVLSSQTELDNLVDAVAVPETWFFRDSLVFSFLAKWVTREWKPAHAMAPLRVLSLPCSSGEEPYSIAMALLDSGFPADRIDIDAIDLRELALQKAQRGIYSRNSFRSGSLEFRDRYFDEVKEGFRIRDVPFDRIRFRAGNILDPGLLGVGAYDVIFCRNLLIYFGLKAKTDSLAALRRALRPDGVLFVGHSETLWVSAQPGFAIIPEPQVFAVRLAEVTRKAQKSAVVPARKVRTEAVPKSVPQRQPASRDAAAPAEAVSVDLLAMARTCANRGEVARARDWIDRSVASAGPSAEAFMLAGLLGQSEGHHAEAARLFEKALYLDPNHQEALTLLALEKERSGDKIAATRLRDRLKRISTALRTGVSRV